MLFPDGRVPMSRRQALETARALVAAPGSTCGVDKDLLRELLAAIDERREACVSESVGDDPCHSFLRMPNRDGLSVAMRCRARGPHERCWFPFDEVQMRRLTEDVDAIQMLARDGVIAHDGACWVLSPSVTFIERATVSEPDRQRLDRVESIANLTLTELRILEARVSMIAKDQDRYQTVSYPLREEPPVFTGPQAAALIMAVHRKLQAAGDPLGIPKRAQDVLLRHLMGEDPSIQTMDAARRHG